MQEVECTDIEDKTNVLLHVLWALVKSPGMDFSIEIQG